MQSDLDVFADLGAVESAQQPGREYSTQRSQPNAGGNSVGTDRIPDTHAPNLRLEMDLVLRREIQVLDHGPWRANSQPLTNCSRLFRQ